MPPDGYETVTLPERIVERLDALDGRSRAAAVRMLLDEYESDDGDSALGDDVIEDIATRTATKTADEVEGRMR